MPIGLGVYAFQMFCVGAIYGAIDAWNRRVSIAIWFALVLAFIGLTAFAQSAGESITLDYIRLALGTFTFLVGIGAGRIMFKLGTDPAYH